MAAREAREATLQAAHRRAFDFFSADPVDEPRASMPAAVRVRVAAAGVPRDELVPADGEQAKRNDGVWLDWVTHSLIMFGGLLFGFVSSGRSLAWSLVAGSFWLWWSVVASVAGFWWSTTIACAMLWWSWLNLWWSAAAACVGMSLNLLAMSRARHARRDEATTENPPASSLRYM